MARYIDADDLKAVIKANDWSNPVVPDVVCLIINRSPDADVVPKSEVERLEAELDDFTVASLAECKVCGEKTTKVIADLQEKLSNAKAEVAREIFAEIEKWLVHEYVPYIRGYSNSLARNFAELKKKYTEGETNG